MSKGNDLIWKGLNVISWIIFFGLCIQATGIIVNTVATLMLSPEVASRFWREVDLSAVYAYNESIFVTLAVLLIIVVILKALLFYFILRIFHDKNLDLYKLFNERVKHYIELIAYIAIGIGVFAGWGSRVADNLIQQGIKVPTLKNMQMDGADVWVFMGICLLIIGFIFKKGIALQNENDLTV